MDLGIAEIDRSRIFTGFQLHAPFFGKGAAHIQFLEGLGIFLRIVMAGHDDLKLRPHFQGLEQLCKLFPLRGRKIGAAGFEKDDVEGFAFYTEQRPERPKRRGHDLGDQVHEGLPDDLADTEFGIVEIPVNRQSDVDHAVAVLQKRHGEIQRQIGGFRALHLFP